MVVCPVISGIAGITITFVSKCEALTIYDIQYYYYAKIYYNPTNIIGICSPLMILYNLYIRIHFIQIKQKKPRFPHNKSYIVEIYYLLSSTIR